MSVRSVAEPADVRRVSPESGRRSSHESPGFGAGTCQRKVTARPARDLGQPIPVTAGVTRREQSRSFALAAAHGLARQADSHVFGPRDPEPDAAAAYWREIDAERRAMSAAVERRQRWRAAVSLASFRRSR